VTVHWSRPIRFECTTSFPARYMPAPLGFTVLR